MIDNTRVCCMCGALIVRRDGETAKTYGRRKTCSEACAKSAMSEGGRTRQRKVGVSPVSYEAPPRQTHAWPVVPSFEDAAEAKRKEFLLVRLPRPTSDYGIGASSADLWSGHRWSGV